MPQLVEMLTIRLKVGGMRARLWLYLPAKEAVVDVLLGSNAGGPPVFIYNEEIEPAPLS
jgi:hypothetical protein